MKCRYKPNVIKWVSISNHPAHITVWLTSKLEHNKGGYGFVGHWIPICDCGWKGKTYYTTPSQGWDAEPEHWNEVQAQET